jgi:hypothetical protein
MILCHSDSSESAAKASSIFEASRCRLAIANAADSATAKAAVSACQLRWVNRVDANTNAFLCSGFEAKYAPMMALRIGGPLPAETTAHFSGGNPIHNLMQDLAVAKPTPPGNPANHQRNFQARAR